MHTYTDFKLVNLPISVGKVPVNLFLSKSLYGQRENCCGDLEPYIDVKLLKFPSCDGKVPLNLFESKSLKRMTIRKNIEATYIILRWLSVNKWVNNGPESSLLSLKSSRISWVNSAISEGIGPVNLFSSNSLIPIYLRTGTVWYSYSSSRRSNIPISVGTGPEIWLRFKLRSVRECTRPSSEGSLPTRSLLNKFLLE